MRAAGLTWIVSSAAAQQIRDSDPSGKLVSTAFANTNTYLLLGAQERVPVGMSKAILTRSFTSYNQLASTLQGGHVSPNLKAVLYDNESWILTPSGEQQDPARYEALAAEAAHHRNLRFIAAPAMDLVTVLGSRPGEKHSDAYLRIGLARMAAASADVIDIQAQSLENSLAEYTQFVDLAAAQARAVKPNVTVIAGLSTNPRGVAASPEQLLADVNTTRAFVQGYWLNVPAASAACPDCGAPRGDIAAAFLNLLLGTGSR
jgi:hypothetical protein